MWLLPSRSISFLPRNEQTGLYETPEQWNGKDSWELNPIYQSISYEVKQNMSPAGRYFEHDVSFKIPKISYYVQDFINLIIGRSWAIMILDQNGQCMLIGDQFSPMRLSITGKIGPDISDLNHIQLTFTGKSQNLAVFVEKPV
ncbi:MAG: hypothetical protein NTV01_10785 [Bacteroidia bacterium]|nr:hypothetical protein [Bacteroidia bacterium]